MSSGKAGSASHFGVVKKFGDDKGGALTTLLA
jgi:hypothetical protein